MLGFDAERPQGTVRTLTATETHGVGAGALPAVAGVPALAPELTVGAFAIAVSGNERAAAGDTVIILAARGAQGAVRALTRARARGERTALRAAIAGVDTRVAERSGRARALVVTA